MLDTKVGKTLSDHVFQVSMIVVALEIEAARNLSLADTAEVVLCDIATSSFLVTLHSKGGDDITFLSAKFFQARFSYSSYQRSVVCKIQEIKTSNECVAQGSHILQPQPVISCYRASFFLSHPSTSTSSQQRSRSCQPQTGRERPIHRKTCLSRP